MKAWIIRVTINKCKNYLKSARRKVLPLKNNLEIAATVKSDELSDEIFELPEFERNVLFFFYTTMKVIRHEKSERCSTKLKMRSFSLFQEQENI